MQQGLLGELRCGAKIGQTPHETAAGIDLPFCVELNAHQQH